MREIHLMRETHLMRKTLLIAVAVFWPALAAAETSLFDLKNSLVQFALEQISTPDEFVVTADGVEEPADGVTDLVGLEIADGAGVWLTVERLSMRWNAAALLGGRLEINRLAATRVRVLRAPEPAGVDLALKEDSAFAQGDGDPFDWPRSPLALLVEELALDDVLIAEGVLSPASVAFDASGAARDQGAEQALRFALTRTDAIEGRIALQYLRDFDAETLRLTLSAQEQAGGLVAALAGLPEDSASRLTIAADGPLTDWRAEVSAASDRVFEAVGEAALSNGTPFRVAGAFEITPGEALDPTVVAALAPRAELAFRAQEDADGVIRIEEGALRAADLDLTVSGAYAKPDGALDLAVRMDARAGLSDLIPGVSFRQVGFDGAVTGALEDLAAKGALTLNGVATEAVDLGSARLNATLGVGGGRTVFDVAGQAEGLRLDKLPPELVGRADLIADGVYEEGALRLGRLRLASPLLTAQAEGALDLSGSEIALDFSAEAPRLAPIAQAYGVEAAGVARVAGGLNGPLAAPALTGDAALSDLRVGQEALGFVEVGYDLTLGDVPQGMVELRADGSRFGVARAQTRMALRGDRLALTEIAADALGAELRGDADVLLPDGLVAGAVALDIPDLRSLRPLTGDSVAGRARGALALEPAAARQNARLELDLRGLSAGETRLATLDARATVADAFAAPAIVLDVDARGLISGDLALSEIALNADGPLSRIALDAAADGAVGSTKLSLRSEALLDAAGDELALAIREAALAYGEERVALARPTQIRIGGGATRIEDLALELPGGVLSGALTVLSNGLAGDLALAMDDLSILSRLGVAPLERGALDASAAFDTRPGRAQAQIVVTGRRIEFEGAVDRDAAFELDATATWDGRRAQTEAVFTGPFGQPFVLTGAAPLRAPGGLSFVAPKNGALTGAARWRGDVGELWALVPAPDHVLDGELSLDLTLGGTLASPAVSGDVALADGRYENLDLGAILTDLTVRSQIAPDGAFALRLRAEDGAGAPVTGEVALAGGEVDAEISSRNAVLIRRDDLTAELSLDIAADGPIAAPRIAGEIRVNRAEARLVDVGAPTVPDLGEVRLKGASPPEADRKPAGAPLDLTISAPGDVFVRGRGLDSEWRLDLKVDGTTTAPRIVGVIEQIRGQFSLLGAPFEFERGRVQFTGATPPDPILDVALTRENDGITGGPVVSGPASNPEIRFAAQPPTPEEDVLPRLLFGRSRQSLSPLEALQLANGLATLLSGGGGVIDDVRGATGLDVLRIDQQGESTGVVAGRDIAEDVFVGVRQPVDGGAASVQVEIEVFDNVTVDSEVGPDRGSSLGLNWRKDF